MFALRRPAPAVIERFLRESARLPLSYDAVGLTRHSAPGYTIDELVVPLGRGRELFHAASRALHHWKHFNLGWLTVIPATERIADGETVAVLIRHCGFWSLNGARIVYTVDDGSADTVRGFAYGTLANHAERGEELFEVRRDPRSDDVSYRIRAASRPSAWLARLGLPVVRALQAKCRRESAIALRAELEGRHS